MKTAIKLAGWVLMGILLLPNSGMTGRLEGPKRVFPFQLPAQPEERKIQEVFEGGQRACILLRGDHKPVVNVGIEVYDEDNRLIAQDNGTGDYAAVIFYPPVTGRYTLRFKNPQSDFNNCYLLIK